MIGKCTRLIAPRERTCSCFLFEVYIEMERQLRIGAHALKHSCFSVRGVWWCDPRRGGNCKFEVLCNYIHSDARWCDPHSLLLPGGIDLRASLWAAQTAGTCACLAPMRNSFVVFARRSTPNVGRKHHPLRVPAPAALNFRLQMPSCFSTPVWAGDLALA